VRPQWVATTTARIPRRRTRIPQRDTWKGLSRDPRERLRKAKCPGS
jgi:hypothetical protein